MIRNYWNEQWKEVVFDEKIAEHEKFKISSHGRILNCKWNQENLTQGSTINGYQTIPLKQKTGKSTSRYLHKLLAAPFLENPDNQPYVIHLDYDKMNNKIENLQWATKREKELHQFKNPVYIASRPERAYSKLTETKVKLIKRKLQDPNRRTRLKMIAKQFGISEMQLYRIKTGENWGSVDAY